MVLEVFHPGRPPRLEPLCPLRQPERTSQNISKLQFLILKYFRTSAMSTCGKWGPDFTFSCHSCLLLCKFSSQGFSWCLLTISHINSCQMMIGPKLYILEKHFCLLNINMGVIEGLNQSPALNKIFLIYSAAEKSNCFTCRPLRR